MGRDKEVSKDARCHWIRCAPAKTTGAVHLVDNTPSRFPPLRMRLVLNVPSCLVLAVATALAGCGTTLRKEPPPVPTPASASAKPGYYKDDGPGDTPPANLDAIPDPVPRAEPLHRFANRPYSVFGREYVPATSLRPYKERGVASWYGRKFHGEKTSTGEVYDMYAMTAAHPTLALPSYARVTNVTTGRSVIVRVNDRGPFLHNRVIDLSYAAAHRVGIAQKGSGEVEVEAILPGTATMLAAAPLPPLAAPATAAVMATPRSPVEPIAVPGAATGFAVQMGAFSSYANAQNFLEHVQNQMAAAQVEAKVRQVDGLFKVYVGPYADRDEARRVAQRLESAFGFATAVAPH
jgi:rare lipoprotein A